jgi:hypothetical protein
MALMTKQPGSNVIGAFSLGLADAPDLGNEFLPNSGYHLPAYTLSLKDLKNLPGPNIDDAAREVAWQCVAVSKNAPEEMALVGEVTPQHQAPRPAGQVFDGPVRMTSFSHGEVIDGAYKKAKDLHARKDDLVNKFNCAGDHEPRVLRIPGLLVTAVWLKSQTPGGTDWVVPLHTKIGDLLTKEMYTMDEFLKITKPLAEKRLASPIYD